MTTRFFSSSPIQGKTALLTGPEAHHLKDVMRIPVDSQVTLFDGSGDEFSCRVMRIERNQIGKGATCVNADPQTHQSRLLYEILTYRSSRDLANLLPYALRVCIGSEGVPWAHYLPVLMPNEILKTQVSSAYPWHHCAHRR